MSQWVYLKPTDVYKIGDKFLMYEGGYTTAIIGPYDVAKLSDKTITASPSRRVWLGQTIPLTEASNTLFEKYRKLIEELEQIKKALLSLKIETAVRKEPDA